ncbi:MAG: UDP-N-acetylmuramoyl-L-alanine--D-glutamate ligase [Jatrophihabitans sp.]
MPANQAAVRGDFAGRSVLVCGAGVAGVPAAQALQARGASVAIVDDAPTEQASAALASSGLSIGRLPRRPAPGTDLVVASPGFRPHHALLMAAAADGIEVIGEIELAWRLRAADAPPWLLVTGTNGKTTTVKMLASILAAAGLRSRAVGNVGVSIIDAVTGSEPYDVLAVEVSSQQLHFTGSVEPFAAALLNLAPDHLDWHGSPAEYFAAKARVWHRAGVAIGGLDDARVAALLDHVAGRTVGVTLAEPEPGRFGIRAGRLVDAAFAPSPVELAEAEAVRPAGAHNVANALAAAALARAFGVPADAVAGGLDAFVPDPHRNQFLATVDGVDWVDDSKATNPHAAAASLQNYSSTVWIAGGQLKGVDVEPLVAEIAGSLRGAVLLGTDRALIAAALARHAPDVPVVEVSRTDDRAMSSVVEAAAGLAHAGDTVLLAPAAASFDMFTGYGQRGEQFAAAVRELRR